MTDRTEQLLLDDSLDIDQKATANRVRNYLTFNFEHLLNYAGLDSNDLSVIDDSHISSPKMDASGVSAHGGANHTIDTYNRIMIAEKGCYAIYETIMKCRNGARKPYRTILTEAYLHNVEDYKIQAMLSYSSSQYDILKRRALCEFADRWENAKEKYGIAELNKDFPDFHVLKNKKRISIGN